jgi:hypothetical protein
MEAPLSSLSSRAYPDFLLNGSHRATYVVLLKENHKPLTEAATLNRKSGGAEGSAVSFIHKPIPTGGTALPLSSRPERTRISCHAALDKRARAPFCKGKAHEVHQRHQVPQEIRGSVVEGSAVQRTRHGNVFPRPWVRDRFGKWYRDCRNHCVWRRAASCSRPPQRWPRPDCDTRGSHHEDARRAIDSGFASPAS